MNQNNLETNHPEEYYRDLLLARKKEECLKLTTKPEETDPSEYGGEATAERLEDFDLRTAGGEISTGSLEEIEKALKWIELGQGSRCAICGKTIEIRRRNADPASITCIEDRNKEDELRIEDLETRSAAIKNS